MKDIKHKREIWVTYAWIFIFIIFMILLFTGCKCNAQIGTQFYFANDSCDFYVPDYSQAVEVRDNCCVDSAGFYQTPHSGTKLRAGEDVHVTLTGRDCSGNTISMSFDVILIDTIPPSFFYDSTQFMPVGQYQNDERIFKLYFTQDTSDVDDYGNGAITQYYKDEKGHQPIATNIMEDGWKTSTLDSPDDWRAQLFIAPASYRLSQIRLKLYKTGYSNSQQFIVEVREVNEGHDPEPVRLSYGYKSMKEIFTDEEGGWHTIAMRPATLYQNQKYAIIVHLIDGDADHTLKWKLNNNGLSNGYAIWTNKGAEETGQWLWDSSSDRLFEIWGKKI